METQKEQQLYRLKSVIDVLLSEQKVKSKADIAEKMGYSRQGTISEILGGRSPLSQKFVKSFCLHFGVNEDFIFHGAGPMFPPKAHTELIADPENKELNPGFQTEGDRIRQQKAYGDKKREGVLYVHLGAQAGYSKRYLDPVYLSELGRWRIEGLPYEGDKFRIFQVSGNSMEYLDPVTGRPSGLFHGMDVVTEVIDPQDWKKQQIPEYHVYVVVTEDQILIKRLFKYDSKTYVMHSDNPDEKPRQALMPIKDIKELWYVKRKVDWDLSAPEKVKLEL